MTYITTIRQQRRRQQDDIAILKLISDKHTLHLLNDINKHPGIVSQDLMSSFKPALGFKKFYSRLHMLINSGLIRRYSGGYHLSLYGIVLNMLVLNTLETISGSKWALAAIESTNKSLTKSQQSELADQLITNIAIKSLVTDLIKEGKLSNII
jgi:hypothetical protein